jgi:hypothetical protein
MTKEAVRKSKRTGASACDICGKIRSLVEHHIHGREVRGWNGSWNLAWLCPDCHEDVHLGEKVIEGWFQTDAGKELVWRLKGEAPKLAAGAMPHTYRGVRPDDF